MKRFALIAGGLLITVAVLYSLFGHKGRELLERTEYPLRYEGMRASTGSTRPCWPP